MFDSVPQILTVLRIRSVDETKSLATNDEEKPPIDFDELERGIRLSRWLMMSYIVLSVIFLVLITVLYRARVVIGRRRRARRGRSRVYDNNCQFSGTRTHPEEQEEETKPLLNRMKKGCWKVPMSRLMMRIRGVLNYQPSDTWGYESPPVSTCLVLALYYGFNIWYMVYDVPWESLKIFFFADRTGVVFTMNMPLLYLTVAKNPLIKVLTGWSYERLNIIHRAVGRLCMIAGIFHVAGSYWVWYTISSTFVTLIQYHSYTVIWTGVVSWAAYVLLALTSKEEFRIAFYETFLFLHVILQALALVFLYFHYSLNRPYVIACVLIFTIDRILYRILYASVRMPGTLTLFPDRETVQISLTPPETYSWPAGGHVFLSIPKIARFHHPHPFSILTPPRPWCNKMDFLIRARDGFSKRLMQEAVQEQKEIEAIVDGPYGCGHAFECLDSAKVAVAVAGGSGIAVIYPLIHAVAIEDHDDVEYGDDDEEQSRESEGFVQKKMILLWIVRAEDNSRNWLPAEALQELRMAGVEVLVHVTQTKRYRPDLRTMLGLVAEDGMGVVVCGPSGMVRDVRNTCAAMQRSGKMTDIVTEKFGW